jgi:hypothetical protein
MKFDDLFIKIMKEATTPLSGIARIDARRNLDLSRGAHTENQFEIICRNLGYSLRKADDREETEDHIDYYMGNKEIPVDVKSDSGASMNIEITKRSGRAGWLYGKAQFIALYDEVEQGFALIDLPALRELVQDKGGFKVDNWGNIRDISGNVINDKLNMVDNPKEADIFKKLFYQRRGASGELQPSIMTSINKSRLKPLVKFTLKLPKQKLV